MVGRGDLGKGRAERQCVEMDNTGMPQEAFNHIEESPRPMSFSQMIPSLIPFTLGQMGRYYWGTPRGQILILGPVLVYAPN